MPFGVCHLGEKIGIGTKQLLKPKRVTTTFGLKTSLAIFQRILRNILKRNDLDDMCVNYIDDIIVFSKTFEEHLQHFERLLAVFLKKGIRLSLSKCNFAKNNDLCHIIENNNIRPIYNNALSIRDFPVPQN